MVDLKLKYTPHVTVRLVSERVGGTFESYGYVVCINTDYCVYIL